MVLATCVRIYKSRSKNPVFLDLEEYHVACACRSPLSFFIYPDQPAVRHQLFCPVCRQQPIVTMADRTDPDFRKQFLEK